MLATGWGGSGMRSLNLDRWELLSLIWPVFCGLPRLQVSPCTEGNRREKTARLRGPFLFLVDVLWFGVGSDQ
jgi:hypothetical protein